MFEQGRSAISRNFSAWTVKRKRSAGTGPRFSFRRFGFFIESCMQQYMEAYLQYAQAAMQGQAAAESALAALWGAMPLATLFLGLQLVLHVVCALIANRLYFKKTTGDLHALHEQTLGESEYRLQLFKKGGTSLLFGFSSYVLYDIAYMLVIQLLAQIL